jgi:hypothetical protein
MTVEQTVWCGGCGKQLDESPNTPVHDRIPCPNCDSKTRKFGVVINAVAEVSSRMRAKARSGEAGKPGGKPWLTTMSEPSWSHARRKWMHREKTENRRDDRYTEVVWDPDTGEIVHQCDEPLSEHRGHGSARQKDDSRQ